MNAKILVVLPTSNFLHRQILEGILEYAKTNGPWQFHLVTGDDFEQGLQATERWCATGYIALVREPAQMKRLFDRKLPGIFLNPPSPRGGRGKAKPPQRTVFVNRDQEGVGQTAVFCARDRRDEVNRIRLNEAVRLLSNSDLSIQEIAIKCGFCCASHLGTRIKQAFKRSPSSFRTRSKR